MARKKKKQAQHPAPPAVPWYKRAWVVISATGVVVSAVLLKAPLLLQNARVLPAEITETSEQFKSWVKEDREWTGHWSAFPEGVVDMADMHLSDVDTQITIWASQGSIDGTIATKGICRSIPFLNFVLLRGEVSGNTARVVAWDVVEGYKQDFAELELVREGDVLTVKPVAGRTEWFPTSARLGKHPAAPDAKPEPDSDFCSEERKVFLEQVIRPAVP